MQKFAENLFDTKNNQISLKMNSFCIAETPKYVKKYSNTPTLKQKNEKRRTHLDWERNAFFCDNLSTKLVNKHTL